MNAPNGALKAGTPAPDFTLQSAPGELTSLTDLQEKPVILAFYPADWSPVCGDQMALYNQVLPEFERHGAVLLGISVDGVWSHRAFAENRNLRFPLLADFEPKGAVAREHTASTHAAGRHERAGAIRDRRGWYHPLELRFSDGRSIPARTVSCLRSSRCIGSGV